MTKIKLLSPIIALVALLTLSVAAFADDDVKFDASGFVGFVGISQDLDNPTSVTSEFKFNKKGELEEVTIKTINEMVLGVLVGVHTCEGSGCDGLTAALGSAPLSSLHNSKARLKVSDRSERTYSLPTPFGPLPLVAEVLSGTLKGKIAGSVNIGSGEGTLYGTTDLKIEGTATYACFSPFLAGLGIPNALPGPLLPCIEGYGELFPIDLAVTDTGKIEVEDQEVRIVVAKNKLDIEIKFDADLIVAVESHVDLDLLVRGDPAAFTTIGTITVADADGEVESDD